MNEKHRTDAVMDYLEACEKWIRETVENCSVFSEPPRREDYIPALKWCATCDGLGVVLPNVPDDLPRKAGTRGAGREGAE